MVGAPPSTQPNERKEACTHRGRPERLSACTAAYTSRMATLMGCSQRLGLVGPAIPSPAPIGQALGTTAGCCHPRIEMIARRMTGGWLAVPPDHRLQCGVTLRRRRE